MTDTAAPANALQVERHISATPDEVFDAWLDPAMIALWLTPRGSATAVVDARVGGRFELVMGDETTPILHEGEYLELHRPHRLRFTWLSPFSGRSTVTVTLEPAGDGTYLTLRHEFASEAPVASHREGWGQILDRLVLLFGART